MANPCGMSGVNKYVGARYVPIVMGEWDKTKTYEPLMVVTYQGNSYTSKCYVPANIDITDTNYWIESANYNAQVESYREEVRQLRKNVGDLVNVVEAGLDDTGNEPINTALANIIQAYPNGATLFFPLGTYLLSGDIYIPKKFSLVGSSVGERPTITNTSTTNIFITGGGNNQYDGLIENFIFSQVQLAFGNTPTDWGNGMLVQNCTFLSCVNAITCTNNCWNMLFDNLVFMTTQQAFYFNFTAAKNSGANLRIQNCLAANGNKGVVIDGTTLDGGHFELTNNNFEHLEWAYYLTASQGNTLNIVNQHFEQNRTGYIYMDGGTVFLNGGWAFSNGLDTFDCLFRCVSGRLVVSNMRMNSTTNKYWYVGENGTIIVDANTCLTPTDAYWNNGSVTGSPRDIVLDNFCINFNNEIVLDGTTAVMVGKALKNKYSTFKETFLIYGAGNLQTEQKLIIFNSQGNSTSPVQLVIPKLVSPWMQVEIIRTQTEMTATLIARSDDGAYTYGYAFDRTAYNETYTNIPFITMRTEGTSDVTYTIKNRKVQYLMNY